MMMQYFHTDGGDNILFESWAPSSRSAVAGASIAIFFFAVFERFVNGLRGRLEGYWAANALHRSTEHAAQHDNTSNKSGSFALGGRVVPPFILAHDLPRGTIHMFQAAMAYALMLIVMTFQVGYFVSVILGLGVGQVIFGRWNQTTFQH